MRRHTSALSVSRSACKRSDQRRRWSVNAATARPRHPSSSKDQHRAACCWAEWSWRRTVVAKRVLQRPGNAPTDCRGAGPGAKSNASPSEPIARRSPGTTSLRYRIPTDAQPSCTPVPSRPDRQQVKRTNPSNSPYPQVGALRCQRPGERRGRHLAARHYDDTGLST